MHESLCPSGFRGGCQTLRLSSCLVSLLQTAVPRLHREYPGVHQAPVGLQSRCFFVFCLWFLLRFHAPLFFLRLLILVPLICKQEREEHKGTRCLAPVSPTVPDGSSLPLASIRSHPTSYGSTIHESEGLSLGSILSLACRLKRHKPTGLDKEAIEPGLAITSLPVVIIVDERTSARARNTRRNCALCRPQGKERNRYCSLRVYADKGSHKYQNFRANHYY